MTHPVCAALHWSAPVRGDAFRALRVPGHWGQINAGLVHADPVVSTFHPVLDNAHVEQRALVEPPGHTLALYVSVLVVILQWEANLT